MMIPVLVSRWFLEGHHDCDQGADKPAVVGQPAEKGCAGNSMDSVVRAPCELPAFRPAAPYLGAGLGNGTAPDGADEDESDHCGRDEGPTAGEDARDPG